MAQFNYDLTEMVLYLTKPGKYIFKVASIEITESNNGNPMLKVILNAKEGSLTGYFNLTGKGVSSFKNFADSIKLNLKESGKLDTKSLVGKTLGAYAVMDEEYDRVVLGDMMTAIEMKKLIKEEPEEIEEDEETDIEDDFEEEEWEEEEEVKPAKKKKATPKPEPEEIEEDEETDIEDEEDEIDDWE